MNESLSNATLLLAYHGATDDPGPRKAGASLAASIHELGIFGTVHAGFYKHEPYMNDLLQGSESQTTYILPMLMSAGYFAQQAFPKFLKIHEEGIPTFPFIQKIREKTVVYTQPLGSLCGISDLILKMAENTLNTGSSQRIPALSETNLALIGHGTTRHSNSKTTTLDLVESFNQSKTFQAAKGFFIEEAPFVKEVLEWRTKNKECVVIPFMAADGPHSMQDIPKALHPSNYSGEGTPMDKELSWNNPTLCKDKLIWMAPPIGLSPKLPDLIIQHIKDLETSLSSSNQFKE